MCIDWILTYCLMPQQTLQDDKSCTRCSFPNKPYQPPLLPQDVRSMVGYTMINAVLYGKESTFTDTASLEMHAWTATQAPSVPILDLRNKTLHSMRLKMQQARWYFEGLPEDSLEAKSAKALFDSLCEWEDDAFWLTTDRLAFFRNFM